MGFAAKLSQRIPAAIDFRFTHARAGVQIRAAPGAEPFAVLAAQRERGSAQQPLFTDRGAKVHLMCPRRQGEDIRIVGFSVVRLDEDEMHFLANGSGKIGQTTPACSFDHAFNPPAPVVPSRSRRGQTTSRVHRRYGPGIPLLPDGVVSREEPVDARGLLLQGPNVEGQHSHGNYPSRRSGSSQRVAVSYPQADRHAHPGQALSISRRTRVRSSIMR